MPNPVTASVFVGIDPGKRGGLTALDGSGEILSIEIMPGSPADLWQWLTQWAGRRQGRQSRAVVEHVTSSPQMGVTSSFTFGMGYGMLVMGLTAVGVPFDNVPPKRWLAEFNVSKRKQESQSVWKERLRARAQQLFPTARLWGCNKTTQLAVCDALLIAEYCRRKHYQKSETA